MKPFPSEFADLLTPKGRRILEGRDPEVCGIRLYVEHENRGAQATYRALGMLETAYRLYEQTTRGS